jgi:hypothetical protein
METAVARECQMKKCDRCDKPSTTHITTVYQDTGEVEESNLCDEHAREFDPQLGKDPPSENPDA